MTVRDRKTQAIRNAESMKRWNDACRWARRLFVGIKQTDYYWYVIHRFKRFRAYLETHQLWDLFSTHERSYQYGLSSRIFKPLREV